MSQSVVPQRGYGPQAQPRRLIVGMSGSTSIILGVRLLEVLRELGIESHLIMSSAAKQVLVAETDYQVHDVEALATKVYGFNDPTAPVASGGMQTMGMAVIPCTMKTLGGIASGFGENTILRAAEVTLKERRRLVLVARETPLSVIDVENMLRVSRAGAIVLPPVLPFYNRPKRLETVIDHLVGKVLDMFGVEHQLYHRWMGFEEHAEYHALEVHRVRDAMDKKVVVLTPEKTAMEAAKMMAEGEKGCAVVLSKETPVGIVTERDLFKKVVALGLLPKDVKVKDIMSSPLVSASPDQSLKSAAKMMNERGIRRLPVVQDGSLLGIITQEDLARLEPHELL